VCVGRVFIMEGNNDVVVISENNPMKTNVKQKKVIKNKEKIAFGFKFKEQYKYKF
jgi:hypothetical protein